MNNIAVLDLKGGRSGEAGEEGTQRKRSDVMSVYRVRGKEHEVARC